MKAIQPIRRQAFTLVEMLVVILIMSILVTLVTLGVTRAMRYASEVGTKTEMAQIEQALGVAALDLGRVPYIPSVLYLWPDQNTAMNDINAEANSVTKGFKQMSLRMLKQMFPNWTSATWGTQTLNATQAFVFILGGKNATEGFSATGTDPFSSDGKRKGPYFNFKPERLNAGSYTYKDFWNNSTSSANLIVYSMQMVSSGTTPVGTTETPAGFPGRAFAGGTAANPTKPYMPKGYQIISSGKDGVFGVPYPVPFAGLLVGSGEDDQANFSESPLGKPVAD
jgi:prepilin-type N-terminal cleavage/methylation domain-containing protein